MRAKRRLTWIALGLLTILLLAACTAAGTGETPTDETQPPVDETDAPADETETPEETEEADETDEPAVAEDVNLDHIECGPAPTVDELGYTPVNNSTVNTLDSPPDKFGVQSRLWNTDFTRYTINFDDMLVGNPARDAIPAINEPQFITQQSADWLADNEPVVALEINGHARAYPLQILMWHEIANDTVCDVPVAVTFCPLCNSAIVFDSRVGDEVYDFGVSGLLINSDLVMYDRTTESLWQQFTGEGIVGDHAGDQLSFIPSSLISFADFKELYPDGIVLSRETGYRRQYGTNPYAGYDSTTRPFLYRGDIDPRLNTMARVVGIVYDGEAVAYPYAELSGDVVNDTVAGRDLVIFHVFGTASALDTNRIPDGEDVGATAVFNRNLDGEVLTFSIDADGEIVDDQTGSIWNLAGVAVSGDLEGSELEELIHTDHFWFSWAAFYPGTAVYE